MSKKQKLRRIMVAMPPEMFEDFREKAEESGLSISRVIYLRLKAKDGMIIVPHAVLQAIRDLVGIYGRILSNAELSADDRHLLQRIVEFEAKLVAFDDSATVVHGKGVKKVG